MLTYNQKCFLAHSKHKYVDKYQGKDGKWYYVYPEDVIKESKNNSNKDSKSKDSKDDKKNKVVDDVLSGKYGVGQSRFNLLKKAGYNPYEIQNLVNKKLGNSYRYDTKKHESKNNSSKTMAAVISKNSNVSNALNSKDSNAEAKKRIQEQIKSLQEQLKSM